MICIEHQDGKLSPEGQYEGHGVILGWGSSGLNKILEFIDIEKVNFLISTVGACLQPVIYRK